MRDIIARLRDAGIEGAEREARILSENFQGHALEFALNRRISREPMSHILGFRDFWKDRFIVSKDVLDPRADSELLIELALQTPIPSKILDLGCGSGALGLSCLREFPNAHCVFVDVSQAALNIARQNAQAIGMMDRCVFVQSNWLDKIDEKFNLILCNPPYIREDEMRDLSPELGFEPHEALTPGGDGLSSYRIIASNLSDRLEMHGVALFEHGYQQQDEVRAIFEIHGFSSEGHLDLNQQPRAVKLFKKV